MPIYINHNHQVYTNPAIINYHVNKTIMTYIAYSL